MVADTLSLTDAARYLVDDILQSPENRQLRINRIGSKVKQRLRMKWNLDVSLPVATEETERIIVAKSGERRRR